MPTLHFQTPEGTPITLDAQEGWSVMEAAVNHNVAGIDADCGGACACATCHVYIDRHWLDRLPPMSEQEARMLEFAVGVRDNSRLSCRLVVDARLDGLVLSIPDSQH